MTQPTSEEPTESPESTPQSSFKLRELIWPVYVPSFMLMMAQGTILPTLPIFARDELDTSLLLAGLVVSAREFGLVGMDIPAGILVSKIGPKWTMVMGVAIFGVSAILAGISDNYWYLFGARLIAGGSFAIWSISRFTYLAANVPSTSRGRAAALFGGTARAAGILGPVIGGFAAQEFGIRTPFFIQAGLAGATLIVVLATAHKLREVKRIPAKENPIKGFRIVMASDMRRFLPATIAAVTLQFLRKIREIIPLWGSAIGISEGQIGIILSSASALDTAIFPISGLTMDKLGRRFTVGPAFLLIASSMILLSLASSFALLLGAALLVGMGNGLTSGFVLTLSGDLAPKADPGSFIGVWRLLTDLGGSLSAPSISALAQGTSLSTAALAASGFGIFGFLVVILTMQETLKRKPRGPTKPKAI